MKCMFFYKGRAKSRTSVLIFTLTFFVFSAQAQFDFSWEVLAPMPMRTSNNAVTQGWSGNEQCVYSFMGLDSTKLNSGIHLRSFKYTPSLDSWVELASVPDTLGKIAASASVVNGLIYIIGGYHVFNGPPYELSSNKVHRFDPITDEYLSDGAPIPVPIDDHVQAVWRDSLIFIITGWSDVDYVPDVQIYNPFNDTWQAGTSVPAGSIYEAFGASGLIIGDTIYYHGGSAGSGFSASGRLRKGVIDPEDPAQITWSEIGNFTSQKGYRSAAVQADGRALWIGGSAVTYNYNGIAYNGSGGVPALDRILAFDSGTQQFFEVADQQYSIMDLRGAAEFEDDTFILCGGMGPGQEVSNTTYRVSYLGPNAISENELSDIERSVWPNPVSMYDEVFISHAQEKYIQIQITDISGRTICSERVIPVGYHPVQSLGISKSGLYFIKLLKSNRILRIVVN